MLHFHTRLWREVRSVIVDLQDPITAVQPDEPGNRAVLRCEECERPTSRDLVAGLGDHAPMNDSDSDPVGPRCIGDGLEASADPRGESIHRLGAGNQAPVLSLEQEPADLIALRSTALESTIGLPDAQMNLAQLGDDHRLESDELCEWRGRLCGALQRADEEGGYRFVPQAITEALGLLVAVRCERWIAVATDKPEWGFWRVLGG